MNFRNVQAPTAAVMVRPHRFAVNPETLADNAFQAGPGATPAGEPARARSLFRLLANIQERLTASAASPMRQGR